MKRNSSGFVLLASLIIVLFLSIVFSATIMRSEIQLKQVNQRRAVQEAFYAAEAGIDRTIFELRRDINWSPGEDGQEPLEDVPLEINDPNGQTATVGFFSIKVADGGFLENFGQTRWVQALGKDSLGEASRMIVAKVLVDDPSRFMVSTPGTLKIKSGAVIEADILGQNLSFDVNKTLPQGERVITVDGDVFYIDKLNPADPQADPDITITGEVKQYPSITFPGVDLTRYASIAQSLAPLSGYKTQGNLTVDLSNLSSLNSDPGFQPQIIYADGDITISGEYNQSILVVAGGNIYIEGDVKPDADSGLPSVPQVGLFAKKDVIIPDGALGAGADLTVEAFVMADGGDNSTGRFMAQSSQALGSFNFKGSISVRSDDEDLTGVDLNIFSERHYTHQSGQSVPFIPFIANILQWSETSLDEPFPPQDS